MKKLALTSLSVASALFAMPTQSNAATVILDPLGLVGDFDGSGTDDLSAGGTFSGGWINSSGRPVGYSDSALAREPNASDQYLRSLDHRRTLYLDLGYSTTGTGELYIISFYTIAAAASVDHGTDVGQLTLYYTSNNARTGTVVDSIVVNGFTSDGVWTKAEVSSASFSIDPGAGKNLYIKFAKTNVGGDNVNDENIGIDNVGISVVPEPNALMLFSVAGVILLLLRRSRHPH